MKTREDRAGWVCGVIRKSAQPGFYGNVKIYYENGFVTHSETCAREKAPVDIGKTEG